jgi:hypothetical protein
VCIRVYAIPLCLRVFGGVPGSRGKVAYSQDLGCRYFLVQLIAAV